MTGLALRSLRYRATAFTATFLAVFLGAALIGSFAALAQTATGDVPADDAETLTIMGVVVGGWGSVIVLFSVASTLSITVRQRAGEIGLLRTVGATPAQARRLVRAEAAAVATFGASLGALVAWPGGALLLALLRNGGVVSEAVPYGGGLTSLAGTVVALVLTSLIAAEVTGRRTTGGPAGAGLRDEEVGDGPLPRWRIAVGLVLIGYGAAMGVVTVTVTAHDADPYAAMATSGSNALLVGVGLAVLSPVLLRWAVRVLAPLAGSTGAPGWLAAQTTFRRAQALGGVLGPVIVLTAAAVGLLMLVAIDGRAMGEALPEGEVINLLNNLVTGMIVVFAAIMVVNAFAAVVASRRRELQRLVLIGATPGQVRRSVLAESGMVAAVGVVLGSVASLATIVPFAVAREEGVVPDGQLWLPPLLVAGAAGLTVAAAAVSMRRAGVASVPAPSAR